VPAVNFGIYMLWVFRSRPPLAGGTQSD